MYLVIRKLCNKTPTHAYKMAYVIQLSAGLSRCLVRPAQSIKRRVEAAHAPSLADVGRHSLSRRRLAFPLDCGRRSLDCGRTPAATRGRPSHRRHITALRHCPCSLMRPPRRCRRHPPVWNVQFRVLTCAVPGNLAH